MANPLLTIGIIFKDNIRSIERCLSALDPLREAVPCELIMADTGSGDGSRQVAERYADILFDFPWINDFSAARNAVMDKASGRWFFTVDTDEYLDPDVSELKRVLRRGKDILCNGFMVVQRSYRDYEMMGEYTDFFATRILRMSTGLRYKGTIHEAWARPEDPPLYTQPLRKTVLHHDGYAGGIGPAKAERNLTLLRAELEKKPEHLLTWLQIIESGMRQPGIVDNVRKAAALVDEKKEGWELFGPPIYQHAINIAYNNKLPELDQWIARAEELFPDSLFVRLGVSLVSCVRRWDQKEYSKCVAPGERYLEALAEYRAGKTDPLALSISTITHAGSKEEMMARVFVIRALVLTAEYEAARRHLEALDFSKLNDAQVEQVVQVLLDIQMYTESDAAPLVTALWESVAAPELSPEEIEKRKIAFYRGVSPAFKRQSRDSDRQKSGFRRDAYTLFLPLREQCDTGRAAAVLAERDPKKLEELLGAVEKWEEFPIHSLAHALECGAQFPCGGNVPTSEEMDSMVKRLANDQESLTALAVKCVEGGVSDSWKELAWSAKLLPAAVRAFDWSSGGEQGLSLAQAFAKTESVFVPRYYAHEVLTKENLFLLPPLHRFGWYCARAFTALEAGDAAGYVRLLREGLETCSAMKPMVEFLSAHTPELQTPAPSAELLALAEQVRSILARFAPDDPAVAALKQSEAYRKVAHLIEGMPATAWGGLTQ